VWLGADWRNAGVVDDDVDSFEQFQRPCDKEFDISRYPDIAGDPQRLATSSRNLCRGTSRGLL